MKPRLRDVSALPPLPPGEYGKHAQERGYDDQMRNDPGFSAADERYIKQRELARGRTADIPYWTAPAGYCRWCGQDMGSELRRNVQRRWHPECAEAYRLVASQGALRDAVWKRDQGVCVDCPAGTAPWPKYTIRRFPCGAETTSQTRKCPESFRGEIEARAARHRRRVCLAKAHRCGPAERVGWEADHVIEVVDGGDHILNNMVTRCLGHHVAKTASARRARVGAA